MRDFAVMVVYIQHLHAAEHPVIRALSAALGVRPRRVLERIEEMVETGTAEYFILGFRPVGKNRFRLTGSSESWDLVYNRGELARAKLTITLEEYV